MKCNNKVREQQFYSSFHLDLSNLFLFYIKHIMLSYGNEDDS